MKPPEPPTHDTPGLRATSTHTIRKTILWYIAQRDLPVLRSAIKAVEALITRHQEFDAHHIRYDFAYAVTQAVAHDFHAWKPWAEAILETLNRLHAAGKLTTRLDCLDAWAEILASIDDALDLTHNQPTPNET
mgnify:CR=1 FL=1